MSISITTLNNEAAAAKTFTLIGRDMRNSEYLNASDSSSTLEGRLFIRQSTIGKTKAGVPIRRALVQYKLNSIEPDGTVDEEATVNITLTLPQRRSSLTDTQIKDVFAYLRNLSTASVVNQLWQGEV